MHLTRIVIENFRLFGSRSDNAHLDLHVRKGLTLLVGENDSGKTAVSDALRLVLGTKSQDYLRITDDDFHKRGHDSAAAFSIYCRFENLSPEESARFLEWLSFEESKPVLELTLRANKIVRKNRAGAEVPVIEVTKRSGPDGEGKAVEGDIRSFLFSTYLKPLRDAESEMSAGKSSRLSQLLLHHPELAGQNEDSELIQPADGSLPKAPDTLTGIMKTAEKWIQESPAIGRAKDQLNQDYLTHLSVGSKLVGEISIGQSSDLKGILEKLELWLAGGGNDQIRTRHGLGFNNVLFMAAELLLLSESAEFGLPLLLIEEPEAHLHPQLQLRLMEFLEQKSDGDSSVQTLVTTHSPNLSSKADVENITMLSGGRAYPMSRSHTKLTPNDYRFLRRFLDTTKANLFFARGVLLVEGDAENILLPTIARLLGRSFSEYGVSVVNVGHRGLFRYARIFQRENGEEPPIKVACISDRDIPPNEVEDDDYVTKTAKQKEKNTPKFESEMQDTGKLDTHLKSLVKYDGGVVRTHVSQQWTLEFDLALGGLAKEMHRAIAVARKLEDLDAELSEEDQVKIENSADEEFDEFSKDASPMEIAAKVYKPLFKKAASKAITAQVLADSLDAKSWKVDELRQRLPDYLLNAIEEVTEPLPPICNSDEDHDHS